MMREHCDRCDKLCDDYPAQVEDIAPLSTNYNEFWTITIGHPDENMFCSACTKYLLTEYLKTLNE